MTKKMVEAAKRRWKDRPEELKKEIEAKRIKAVKEYWSSLSPEERRERALRIAAKRKENALKKLKGEL